MKTKTFKLSLAVAYSVALVSAGTTDVSASNYYDSLTSQIDPTNITLPSIDQMTSLDVDTQCTYYTPDELLISINSSEFPAVWDIATTNGMNTSAEFTALFNSIDWTSAPNVSVRTFDADGNLDTSGYESADDSDCWWSATTCTVPKLADVNADIYKCDEPETWGLTYDDGPNCSHNALYDYLQQNSLKASMFYIGSNVLDWPYGALRGVADGHHIASHTWSHQYMTTLTNKEVLAELYYTQKAIKLATGVTPRYWRPPYGDVDDRVRWVATQLGLTAVIWNYDTDDWEAENSSSAYATVEENYNDFIEMGTNGTFAESGNIILTHEIDNATMALAVNYLPKITAAYKQVLDVATCANITQPYFENYIWDTVMNSTSDTSTNSSESTVTAVAARINVETSDAEVNGPKFYLVSAFVFALFFA